jgi:hypothetical protein
MSKLGKGLALTAGILLSAASFACLNDAGSKVATTAFGIGKWSVDVTRGAYVMAAKPATETVGHVLEWPSKL